MKTSSAFRSNARRARAIWGQLSKTAMAGLKELIHRHSLSVSSGDLQLIDGRWYVTHSGLLRIAKRCRCSGITTSIDRFASDVASGKWVFKAIVYKGRGAKRFVGYGDADPSNVSPLVRGAEMRIAETRAVNRALRKAYGIGLCSIEELGWVFEPPKPSPVSGASNGSHSPNGSNNGQPRLRDQLCLLIRQHNLDPKLVKAYAADFCGTQTLKDASRDLVGSFISHLSSSAKEDLEGLICKLNSYSELTQVKQ
ncbi:MAG: hypothetical protein WAN23_00120 [Candidatus Acidiferrales bacterium]